ncbi:hypothetical protein K1W54_12205 [Micromonospora sp. CPCC 205371]|nr:hypothetical protein [Micromonospora sp. CPCC 205371]
MSKAITRFVTLFSRMTFAPMLVRALLLGCAMAAFVTAFSPEMLTGYMLGILTLQAGLAAVLPRSPWVTIAVLIAVGGWGVSTIWYDEPIELWRLIGLATFLYLTHSLAALASSLPYDAIVAPEVLFRWVSRALAVVLGSAVLAVLVLGGADLGGDRPFLLAALAGLAVAVGASALLSWLLRRS